MVNLQSGGDPQLPPPDPPVRDPEPPIPPPRPIEPQTPEEPEDDPGPDIIEPELDPLPL
jgi:hypothetical protein